MDLPLFSESLQLLLLLLPGFLSFEALRFCLDWTSKISPTKTIYWSLFFSLIIYFTFGFLVGYFEHTSVNFLSGYAVLLQAINLERFFMFLISIILVVTVSVLVTKLVEKVHHFSVLDVWPTKAKEMRKLSNPKGLPVFVYTTDRKMYYGGLEWIGNEKREISITKPQEVVRKKKTQKLEYLELGLHSMVFCEKNIARIAACKPKTLEKKK